MNNCSIQINGEVLRELDDLIKKAGVSRQEFLNYVGKFYNTSSNLERNIVDYNAYYESFVG